jgi:hypothetical protein
LGPHLATPLPWSRAKARVVTQNIKFTCGNSYPIQGKSDLTFHFPIKEVKKIKDMFYGLGLQKNQLFVGSLINQGIVAKFNVSNCFLINKQGIIVVKGARERNGLYKLEILIVANEILCVISLNIFSY